MIATGGSRELLGSKGFELYRLTLLGVRVPDLRVLTTECHTRYRDRPFDDDMVTLLRDTLEELGGRIAVRSSSVVEDLSGGSRAGMFRTVLDVDSHEGLLKAVKDVWASSEGHRMAVVLQRQLDPILSGVLFTRNPLDGGERTIIEFVEGRCSSLVSGRVDPERLEFENEGPGLNNAHPAEKGPDMGPLIGISRYLEKRYGYPLDIEWALCRDGFHLLQVRPITGLTAPGPDARTYSRVQAEQFYSGPVTPLFHSIFRRIFTGFYLSDTLGELGVDIPVDDDFLLRHRNFLYIDTAVLEYALGSIPLKGGLEGIRSSLPSDIRDLPRRSKADFPALAGRLLLSLLHHGERRPSRLDRHFGSFVVFEILRQLDGIGDMDGMDDKQLAAAYQTLMDTVRVHVSHSKWGLLLYSIPLMGLAENVLARNGLERYFPDILAGFSRNRTMDASDDIRYLASMAQENRGILKVLEDGPEGYRSLRDALLKKECGDRFVEAFENTLEMHGHRRLSRDIFQPSWRDDPMIPLSMVGRMALSGSVQASGREGSKVAEKRREASRRIRDSLGFRDGMIFRLISRYLLRYMEFREYQRFYLDLILARMKDLLTVMSDRMVEDGVLDRREDIFFLEMETLLEHLSGGRRTGMREEAVFNRVSFEDISETPGRYLRNGIDFDTVRSNTPPERDRSGTEIRGQPVSSGEYRGRMIVVRDLGTDVRIGKGDILVTRYIDPGQTHLFLMAGALVLEVGGMLSHGAILAREFNIPTVAGISDATTRYRNLDTAIVNGTEGTVTLLDHGFHGEVKDGARGRAPQ
ncbi:MAG: PEP/pyruvate-binding domain-containing protein [Thermoplasmatota archaeon]